MSKQLRMVTAVLRYAAFTETDQEALDFIHQAKGDWSFADDGATVDVVTSLDSRVMPLPKDDLVYHERMGSGVDKTIEDAFKESPKESSGLVLHSSQVSAKPEAPKSLAPATEEVLDF